MRSNACIDVQQIVDYNIQMFLSKKNAEYLNRPKKGKALEQRVLPGWGDDEDNEAKNQFKVEYKNNGNAKNGSANLLGETENFDDLSNRGNNQKQQKQNSNKKTLYTWDQLNEMNNIECEKRLVESIVQPVGVKVKPTQNLLTEFVKESRSMDPIIVGSLLLSKLEVNYPFLVKAKSLYTIEHLVKKNPSFLSYFKSQIEKIQIFPEPEDNVENYRKIMKNVLNIIGVSTQKSENPTQNQTISFVDPGYNDPKEESQIRGFLTNNEKTKRPVGPASKKFISPNDAKKVTQQQKKEDIFDLFSDGKQQANKTVDNGFDDLILVGQVPAKNSNNITFDDLLK